MNRENSICWFHGKVSREQANEILLEEGKGDGVFLVRESNSSNGDFVLSLLHQGEVYHYQIRRHGEDAFFSIDDHKTIHGLDSLIEHYQESSNGLVTQLSAIVKRDPPPNDSRSHGHTNLLHRATKSSNETVVSELLKCGYRNFDAKNQDGQTAIHLACIYSNEEILKLLLNVGVNVNCRDTAGYSPIHYAARTKSASFIRTLINANANILIRNMQNSHVALHEAAKYGNLEAVKELLANHATHLPRTSSGEFPIDFAKEQGHTEVEKYLKEYTPPAATTYKHQWYHGTLDRREAVSLLQEFASSFKEPERNDNNNAQTDENKNSKNKDDQGDSKSISDTSGTFLVRYSVGNSRMILTMLYDNAPKNYPIHESQKHWYIDEGPYLPSLEHLIEHYSLFADGLPINLRHPVAPKPKPPLPLPFFSTLPKAESKHRKQNGSATTKRSISTTEGRTHQRNISHPGDEAMNKVGLFEDSGGDGGVEEVGKFKKVDHVFRSLKLRSPKKKSLSDKTKNKSPTSKEKSKENDIKIAETLIKNISFSANFKNASIDSLYNTPQNNCAVVDIDIGEGNNSLVVTEESLAPSEPAPSIPKLNEVKNETEIEYFTKSDKDICIERNIFVDAPPAVTMRALPVGNNVGSRTTPPSFKGYVPTEDIRVFFDSVPTKESDREESAAELRQLSKQPERIDSIISSTSSIASEFSHMLSRQSSNCSEHSKTKLHYFIPRERLILGEIIGEGEFATVYKGSLIERPNDNAPEIHYSVAIKTLRNEHTRTNEQEFLREASVMIRLQHHCIVKLLGLSKGESLMMVQELVPCGSMLDFIQKNPTEINPNCELQIWASQIACGMNYLESHHFVHRDLAARNILLSSRNQAKISDFGLSRALGSGDDFYTAREGGKWPIKWYAPESYNHGVFSSASDVWSFGVTLWEMFTLGKAPYGEMRGVEAMNFIESGHRLPKPKLCPGNVYKMMENCWNYNAKDRPTFRYLTEYFANEMDYQNLTELITTEHIS